MLKVRELLKEKRKILILLAIFLVLISLELVVEDEEEARVAIFVLDDFTEFDLEASLSHGEIVARIVEGGSSQSQIFFHHVADEQGIKEELYLTGLQRALNYKQRFSEQEVLVNISLSFADYTPAHRYLINKLAEEGVGIIAAAGNNNSDEPIYPAAFAEVIAVASVEQGEKSPFSNYGAHIDLAANGSIKHSIGTYLGTGLGFKHFQSSGTSFAAPRVTALWARLLESEEELSLNQALELIIDNADPLADEKFRSGELGVGLINVGKTLGQVDPYYWLKANWLIIVTMTIFLVYSIKLIKEGGLPGLFISLLILIGALPMVAVVEAKIIPQLQSLYGYLQAEGLHISDYLLLTTFVSLPFLFADWQERYLAVIYSALFSILAVLAYLAKFDLLELKFYLMVISLALAVLFVAGERLGALYLKGSNSLSVLLWGLRSRSSLWRKVASAKLADEVEAEVEIPLLRLLDKSKKHWVKISIIKLLADRDISNLSSVLQSCLMDKHRQVRLTAFKFLLKEGSKLRFLFDFALRENIRPELIKKYLAGERQLFFELLNILKEDDETKKELAGEVIAELVVEVGLEDLKVALQDRDLDRKVLLTAISQSSGQSIELAELLKQMILSEHEMWLRYQALTALAKVHPQPQELLSFFKKLKSDPQELVRLQATEIIERQFDS
ncbi:S8 family peptidase [Fuchsiella alkaliacetigena]|uniref:S8 family peptidase n=1 Tax=Fuchsiella alkaliacetigena TaxID=957042 RepID=UPI00200B263E|nr:S8 family serine peptidase [Fuchsiella alkaliacetigena]MCK8824040.1 S8 family serine peptidase [Fuchsiella alkaliacetigena]